jgi:hypothetical protein
MRKVRLPIADRMDIAELLHRYSWASDERRWAELAACFTADAVFTIEAPGAPPRTTRGRDAIVAMVQERHRDQFAAGERRRHTTSGLVIDAESRSTATAISYVAVIVAAAGTIRVATLGRYRDVVQKLDGAWLIAERVVHIDAAT